MKFERSGGIILHITSLPGKYGIGSLGKNAFEFIDFLSDAGQKIWQILPLGHAGFGFSPYQTFSAFAGYPLMIDLDDLVAEGLISKKEISAYPEREADRVNYKKIIDFKTKIFKHSFKNFTSTNEFDLFCNKKSTWLEDYSLFVALKQNFGNISWCNWDKLIKLRDPDKLEEMREQLKKEIFYHKFLQFFFFKQWQKVKNYAQKKGIKIFGDIPIFISFDSADAWTKPEIFQFDEDRNPIKVAGVPPDFFSKTGQLWGNPLYNWLELEEQDFAWWIKRFQAILELVDIVRIDHFRGFAEYWAIPAGEKTAINGKWEPAPGKKLFENIQKKMGELPVIAEDLGIITDNVIELRDRFNFPGMKILQFAFDSDLNNPYLPHNYPENCVVYTGTHDNDTTLGWYKKLDEKQRKRVDEYLNYKTIDICWQMIETAWKSKADIAIIPMQDLLGLDSSARMNTPGTSSGNWMWRVRKDQLNMQIAKKLRTLTRDCGR